MKSAFCVLFKSYLLMRPNTKPSSFRPVVLFIVAVLSAFLLFRLIYVSTHRPRHHAKVERLVFHDRLRGKPYTTEHFDGIDVSKHNGNIMWNVVATNPNVKFVYIKATEGNSHSDRSYLHNAREAHIHGLKIGAYHFLTSKSSMAEQFANFKRLLDVEATDLVPVVDVEEGGIRGRWRRDALQDSVAVFSQLVKNYCGRRPVIYSNQHFYNEMLAPQFNDHYLFIANYNGDPPAVHGSGKANMWQFTEKGHIRGIGEYVDLIRFMGNIGVNDITR